MIRFSAFYMRKILKKILCLIFQHKWKYQFHRKYKKQKPKLNEVYLVFMCERCHKHKEKFTSFE